MLRFLSLLCLLLSTQLFGFIVSHGSHFTFQTFKSAIQKAIDTHLMKEEAVMKVTSEFQDILDQGPIPVNERTFIIQGWRWHTMSVIKDLDRFQRLATIVKSCETNASTEKKTINTDKLQNGFNYVFNFNWKALMRIEREIFFPWLTSILPDSSKQLISDIVDKHTKINELTTKLNNVCTSCDVLQKNHESMLDILNELKKSALEIQLTQENYLVPYISAYVSKREQGKFNRRVLSNLGLLNSQIHLVSMQEAIKDSPEELKKFAISIPSVARALIPVWRSNFYTPRTSCFEGI